MTIPEGVIISGILFCLIGAPIIGIHQLQSHNTSLGFGYLGLFIATVVLISIMNIATYFEKRKLRSLSVVVSPENDTSV